MGRGQTVQVGIDLPFYIQNLSGGLDDVVRVLDRFFQVRVKEMFLRDCSATSLVIFPFSTLPGR